MIKHFFALEIDFQATHAGEALHLLQAEQHLGLGAQAGAVRRPQGGRGGRRALRPVPVHPRQAHELLGG